MPAARFFRERQRLTQDLAGQLYGHVRDASQPRKQAKPAPVKPSKSDASLREYLKLRAFFCDAAAGACLRYCWLALRRKLRRRLATLVRGSVRRAFSPLVLRLGPAWADIACWRIPGVAGEAQSATR